MTSLDVARGRRLGWGLGDQALCSATSFAIGIIVARSVSAVEFGAFALAFSVYSLATSVSRAMTTESYLVLYSAADEHSARDAARRVTGTALLLGTVGGAIGLSVCLVVPHDLRAVLAALSVSLPALLLQDCWRQVFFGLGRGRNAFANDAVWAGTTAVLLTPALLSGSPSAATLLLLWGTAAGVAAVTGGFQAQLLPRPRAAVGWLRETRSLWPRFAGESALIAGAPQLYVITIAAAVGLVAAGQLRLILIVLGPVHVLIQGIGLVALPEGVRSLAQGRDQLTRHALAVSAVIAGGAAAWGLLVLSTPLPWWTWLAGPGWAAASALLIPMSLHQILNGANTGAHVGIRAMRAASRSLRTRLVTAALLVAAPTATVLLGGDIRATAWALAAVAGLNCCIWWAQYARTQPPGPLRT